MRLPPVAKTSIRDRNASSLMESQAALEWTLGYDWLSCHLIWDLAGSVLRDVLYLISY